MHTKNKIAQKFIAMLLVMALFISTAAPTVASALEFDCYVAHMDATGGVLNTGNPYTPTESHSIQQIWLNISGSEWPALCLEFNTSCFHDDTYHYNDSHDGDRWDNLNSNRKRDIGLIMHYGYYNHSISRNNKAYFDATQLLVWEVAGYQWYNSSAPLRGFNYSAGTSSCATPLINYYTSPYRSDTVKAYNSIIDSVKNHYMTGWHTSEATAKAHPVQLKYNSANGRFEATVSRVPSIWNDFGWTSKLEAKGIHVVNQGANSADPGNNKYYLWTDHEITNPLPVSSIKQSTVNNDYNMVYVYSNSTRGTSGQSVARGANPDTLTAWLAVKTEPPPVKPAITIEKYAENETIANVPNYSSVKGSLVFSLQAKTGSTWNFVYFTSSGNKYTYSRVGNGSDPWQLKLDDKGEFILAGLPYGTYRIYESWRGSPTGLKSAGLQNPPSSYVKEFTVSASSASTLQVNNEKIQGGSLEIDKKVDMVEKNTPIPDSAYTSLTFTIKDKSGQYLVLDTVDAAAGTYKYKSTTATEANATKIKLGTSTHKAVVTDMPIDTGYVVEETCGDPRFKAYSDTVTVNIVAETSSDAPFTNYEVYGSIKGTKVDKNDPSKKLVGAVYGLFKEGTTTFNTSTAYKTATSGSDGVFTFDKVPYGNYIIRELTAPQGYKLSTEQKNVSITSQGQTVTFQEEDPPINIWFSKKSVTGNAELAGAKMQLRTSTGSVIDSWTSGSSAHLVSCVAAGSYVLHEEAAPNGYVLAQDIRFNVDTNGKVTGVSTTSTVDGEPIITMTDDITKVTVYKKDITNSAELAGAKLQIKDSKGSIVDSWTSTNEPHKINGKLIAGATYTLHEELAPDGYVVAKDIAFTVDPTGKVTEVTMTDDVTKVTVYKKDITNNAELAGAKLQIKDSKGSIVDSWTSTNEPHKINGKLIAGATYTLHEELAPDGYVVAKDIAFTVDPTGKVTEVTMTDDVTKVTVYKKDITNSAELAGAKLQIKDSKGSIVDSWTSTNEPHKINGKLIAGATYTLHEELAPDGYVVAKDIAFTVDPTGKVTEVTMTDDVTKITVSKKTITGSDELVGAKMQLLDSNGNVVDEWTSTSEPHDIYGKLVAGQTYTLHEEYAPDGYVIASDITFVVSEDGSVDTVTMKDDTTKVQISKQDITNGKELAGAKLQVKDSSGKVVDEWTSTDTPHYIEGKLTAGETYTLHEEAAPNGYVVANDITFVVSEDGSVDTVTMKDDTTKVQISKQDITNGKELAGAKLQVKDSSGKVVDEWTSTDIPHYIEGKLTAGETYTLHEEAAPNGYVVANDITFVVSEDGSVDTVTMKDDTTKVQISKQDITNGKELAGAKLQVKDSSGNVVDEWTSTSEPHDIYGKLVAGQTYTLHEEYAPDGYVIASDITFVVSEDGSVDTVKMVDDTTKVQISKQDVINGKELAGAKLQVKDSAGKVVDEWTSTDKPHYIEGKLTAGQTYTLHEEVAPNGYVVANDITFVVSEDGSVDTVKMVDDTTKVQISKQDITNGKELAGAKLQVKDSSGKVVDEWTSTDTPHYIEGKLTAGEKYTLHEEAAPNGYVVANDITFVVSEDGSVDTVTMKDDRTKVAVSKKDLTTGKELAGAELVVYDDKGNEIDRWITTDRVHYVEALYTAGKTYTLHEEYPADGYSIAKDVQFTVSDDGRIDVAVMIDDTTKVQISKQDITDGSELAGAKLQVKDSDGNIVDEWTSTDKPHYIEGKLVANKTYTLHEEVAPDGYVVANDIEFTVSSDGSIDTVQMIDDIAKGTVSVQKTTEGMLNIEGIDLVLSGVSFLGLDVNITATTDENGIAVFEGVPVGTYTITEEESTVPYGYLIADPVEGVEVIYAQQTDVEIFNAEMTGSIAVSKTTEGMVNLEGIEFILSGVTDTGREIELKALTDEAGTAIFENVPIGTYTITENGETVPYGYLTADPIEGVEVIYAQQTNVEIYNAEMTGSIRVQKKTEGMKDLEGIGFTLSGTTDTGREISMYVKTDKDGLAVFEGVPVGTYTLTEDGQTVPKGYLIARAVEGVEVVYSEQTDITVVNEKVPENPKTGDTAPYAAVAVCTLIAAAALLLRKRTDNFID